MRNIRTCGEAIVDLIEAQDVDTVFGIPGVHTLELYRGLVNSRIRHILPRHEQGAAFMADGYARATGKPGVCFLITGPGVTNAATAIGEAWSDSVPMLVLSSVNPDRTLGKGRGELHELKDQQALMNGCTAFSRSIRQPEEFPQALADAYDIFNSTRPRPVHIEVPIDVFEKKVETEWRMRAPRLRKGASSKDIAEAVRLLSSARNPAIIAGGGALGAGPAILEIAEKLSAPVATSVAGAGVFPASHKLSLGPTLVCSATMDLLDAADVVLAVGTELSTTDTWGREFRFSGKLIRIDIDPLQLANHYKAALGIEADAGAALAAIAAGIEGNMEPARLDDACKAVAGALAAHEQGLDDGERLRSRVFKAIEAGSPPDTMFVGDMTQIGYTAHAAFRPDSPGRFFFPQGYGTLGYALPAAIGAKLGAPSRPVVALAGDGGLLYTIQEMATAVDEGVPVVLVLWNNHALKQIRDGFVERGIEPIAVSPKAPDFQAIARGFGWQTLKVAQLGEISQALRTAHEAGVPVMVEIEANALPGSEGILRGMENKSAMLT